MVGRARFGKARELIRWLHDEELPRALALAGCVGAEGFAGDDDHRVMLMTPWSSYDAYETWAVAAHRDIWRADEEIWLPLGDAGEQIR